jgi:serine/threonine-protein kinase
MPGSAVSDLAGRVLAGRYLLHNAIGTGASGRVYAADDTRLRRRVAVKVLHAALAEDAAFLRRFRAEAQLAASLHHPHIVTVHDWGEDDMPFMVLELLEGGSLRAMLDEGTRLSLPQAARVGRDVASALEYAHGRGVLHRDIKPANLLFDEHGIVRVADFGLARALAEASWTEPAGAVFGTARYASPEQAQGVHLDGRSDVYSLSLVLVESVTGNVPFAADTTLGTLSARTQRSLEAPEMMGKLAPVVERAGALLPDDRYPNAATMRAALSDAGDQMPPPSPLTLAGMADRVDPHPTRAVASRNRGPALFDQDTADIAVVPDPDPVVVAPAPTPTKDEPNGQRRWVPLIVAIVLLITIALAVGALANVRGSGSIPVPSFIGLTKTQAEQAAQQQNFQISWGDSRAAPDPKDTVIDQSPDGGGFTGSRHLRLVLSSGPAPIVIPSIVGRQWSDAQQLLDKAGIIYGTPTKRYDEKAPVNTVLQVTPPGNASIAPDKPVAVVLSKGHAPVRVPDVTGMSFNDASKALTDAKFKVTRGPDAFSSSIDKGDVVSTDPPAGNDGAYGGTVTVTVSKGPDLVTVPNLINLTPDRASQALAAVGLNMLIDGPYPKKSDQLVWGQSVRAGSKVKRNSDVTVTFKKNGCVIDFIICIGG